MLYKLKIILAWLAVISWMVVIWCFSAQVATESAALSHGITETVAKLIQGFIPQLDFELIHHFIRKCAHFSVYLVLGVFVTNALNLSGKYRFLYCILICAFYAMTDEFHQYFVPGRGPAIKDILIDSAGSITGIFLWSKIILKI